MTEGGGRALDVCKPFGIPGIGIIAGTALAASVTAPNQFRSGRQFVAWLGLTPKQHSTGGKTRLGGISKQRDRYLRRLLVIGAAACGLQRTRRRH